MQCDIIMEVTFDGGNYGGQLNIEMINNLIIKGQKIWTDISPQMIYEWD